MYLNRVLLYGNLTRDPELKTLPSGIPASSFSLATNLTYKDREGKKQEKAEYHNIVVFGPQAETVNKWLKKGSGAMVEGRLQTTSWEKEGQKHYRTEIVAERVQFGPRAGGDSNTSSSAYGAPAPGGNTPSRSNEMPAYPTEDIDPEDIPF